MNDRIRPLLQAVCLLGLVAALVWLWSVGTLQALDVQQTRVLIQQAGPLGPVIYLLLFGLLQPIGLSAHVLVPAAALAWSPGWAVLLAWSGSMLAATAAFWASRTVAREAVQARVPDRMRRWDDALASRGFRTVLMLRLIFWTTFVVQMMFGLSQVRFRDYFLGTALGNLPLIVIEILFVEQVLGWLGA